MRQKAVHLVIAEHLQVSHPNRAVSIKVSSPGGMNSEMKQLKEELLQHVKPANAYHVYKLRTD